MEYNKLSKEITLKNVIFDKQTQIKSLFKFGSKYCDDNNKRHTLNRDISIIEEILKTI